MRRPGYRDTAAAPPRTARIVAGEVSGLQAACLTDFAQVRVGCICALFLGPFIGGVISLPSAGSNRSPATWIDEGL